MLESRAAQSTDGPSLLPSHRSVLASAAMLGVATVLVKLVALAKDWMVARQIGAGDELDAFLVAFIIPSFGVTVLGQSFALAFVPTYLRVHAQQSAAAAARLVGTVALGGFVALVGLALVLALAAPYLLHLVGSSFDDAKLALTVTMFYLLAPVLVAGGLSSIFAAVLNAHEHFRVTALAPLTLVGSTVTVFWLFQERFGIYALAGGLLLGFTLECCVLAIAVIRLRLIAWPAGRLHPQLGHVGSQYAPVVVGSLLMSSSAVVDQSMAASLGSGTVSVLDYGNKIVALVLTIVAVSLSTVLFPRFSRLIAEGRWGELKRTLYAYATGILLASIPVVALLAFFAEPMIRLLFERGKFTAETTHAVSLVQMYLSLQVPFYILVMLGFRVLAAMDCNQIALRIGAMNLVLNVCGNYLFMQWLGVNGIALSTSLVYATAMVVTLAAIHFKMAEGRARTPGAS